MKNFTVVLALDIMAEDDRDARDSVREIVTDLSTSADAFNVRIVTVGQQDSGL